MGLFFKFARPFLPFTFIIGGILLVCTVFSFIHKVEFLSKATAGEGIVTQLVELRDSNGESYSPVFGFVSQDGTKHTIYSSTSSYPPAYSVGEKVSILYDTSAPDNAIINSFFSVWGFTLVIGVVGSFFFLISIAGFRRRRRLREDNQ